MVRRKSKAAATGQGFPAWMVTFSDLTTLLMTFFVMLVSMASMTDTYKRKIALGSVSGEFGTGAPYLDDLTTADTKSKVDPGPINMFKDLQEIRTHLWENPDQDLHFESNRFIQRVSLDGSALFDPGSADLTLRGRELLDKLRPTIAQSAYPLGLSGHTTEGRDEFGPGYLARRGEKTDFSWRLSLERTLAVYRYFIQAGVAPDKLRMEAFGRFRPKTGDATPEGRNANRRVDITLDTRVGSWAPEFAAREAERKAEQDSRKTFKVGDFIFRFDLPGGE